MKRAELTRPELGLFAATRAMLGAGGGLLVADKLDEDQRKVIGWTLFLMGVVSTVPRLGRYNVVDFQHWRYRPSCF